LRSAPEEIFQHLTSILTAQSAEEENFRGFDPSQKGAVSWSVKLAPNDGPTLFEFKKIVGPSFGAKLPDQLFKRELVRQNFPKAIA